MLQPSLVRFFGHVSGIISERGAYLSHAAIVGREAGVPILVLPRALSTLAQGTVVSVTEGGAVSCG
jgi:phosphohistidine swiveling domain-containing protein